MIARLPWTKFQDFYLRLGFLKVLVAALNPERRSANREAIIRRIRSPLLDPVQEHGDLWQRIRADVDWYPRKAASRKGSRVVEAPEVAEALLVESSHPSLLYGVTSETAYKVLDWAHDVEFIGRGQQITERGLMLRGLLDIRAAEAFLSGDVRAWNPFAIDERQRLFFMYHLFEIDRLTVKLIADLSTVGVDDTIETADASKMTCKALFRVLEAAEAKLLPRSIPAYRTALELACTMADELELEEGAEQCADLPRRGPPKAVKPSARSRALAGKGPSRRRRTTKNADHQTIPRFEQLVDLGFLEKPAGLPQNEPTLGDRRRWRYRRTSACCQWPSETADDSRPFLHSGFAAAAAKTVSSLSADRKQAAPWLMAEYLWNAYRAIGRPIGHSPLESVALRALIDAAVDGVPIEMAEFHSLLLRIKRESALPEHAFFASGNDLDKMFILLKRGFVNGVAGLGWESAAS